MIYVDIVLAAYLLLGILFACAVDRDEMKKHVPYGEVPSVVSLSVVRRIIFGLIIMFGGLIALRVLFDLIADEVESALSLWKMKRSVKRICRKHGLNFTAVWREAERRYEVTLHEREKLKNDRSTIS